MLFGITASKRRRLSYDLVLAVAEELGFTLPTLLDRASQRILYNSIFDRSQPWTMDSFFVFTKSNLQFSSINWANPLGALATFNGTAGFTYDAVTGVELDGVDQYIDTVDLLAQTITSQALTYGYGIRITDELDDSNFRAWFGSKGTGGSDDLFFRLNNTSTYFNRVYTTKNNIVHSPLNDANNFIGGETTFSSWYENADFVDSTVVPPEETTQGNSLWIGAYRGMLDAPASFGQFKVKHFFGGLNTNANKTTINGILNTYHNS